MGWGGGGDWGGLWEVEYADEISHPGCLRLVFAPHSAAHGLVGATARWPDGW